MEKKTIRNQILDLSVQGVSKEEIALRLNISVHTVKAYILSLKREYKNISFNNITKI